MKVIATSVGQAFLVGAKEDDDQVLVLTLRYGPVEDLYCSFCNSTACVHTGVVTDSKDQFRETS